MPTKRQKERAIAIIRKDCIIDGLYYHNRATCAIGALGLDAKVSIADLIVAGSSAIIPLMNSKMGRKAVKIQRAIKKRFGLTARQQQDIQERNDRLDYPEERRKSIIAYIKSL